MESPLKKRYDDAMLNGSIEGAYLTKRYGNIKRIDGFNLCDYDIRHHSKKMAEKSGGDGSVAAGIATAILDSIIIYGEIGEKFLIEKSQQEGETFSREEYIKDIAKAITELYQYDRKQKIVDGVIAALEDDPNNIEANVAKTVIMQNEYWNEDRYPEADVLEERFLNGTVISMNKIYRRLEYMHHKEVSDEQALKNLNLAYNHLKNNYDKISDDFKASFQDLSENKIIAYFIANLHDDEMERVLKDAKEVQSLDER